MQDLGLYIVMTKPILDYMTFTKICVAEEVPMLQLRDKHLTDREMLKLAIQLKAITQQTNTKFIINDRPDLALLSRADGLHLGQDDYLWTEAGKLLSNNTLMGISTHSMEQATEVIEAYLRDGFIKKPDYMSFGPIFPTTAKAIPDPAVGLELLKQVIKIAPLPVVAIGGIFPSNIEDVISAGARNIAMIRHFTLSKDVTELRDKIRNIKSILKENSK